MEIVQTTNRDFGEYYALKSENAPAPFKNYMKSLKKLELRPDDIVADIGAYVGEFSLHAIQTVKKVKAYEASPEVFECLKLNKRPGMQLINKAVTGDNRKKVDLHISKGLGATNSIKKSRGKAETITVPAIRYEQAIKDCSVVKIDVEGAEYDYNLIQPHLRAIIIEFHNIEGIDWHKEARKIMSQFRKAGFKALNVPKFVNTWDANGVFIR